MTTLVIPSDGLDDMIEPYIDEFIQSNGGCWRWADVPQHIVDELGSVLLNCVVSRSGEATYYDLMLVDELADDEEGDPTSSNYTGVRTGRHYAAHILAPAIMLYCENLFVYGIIKSVQRTGTSLVLDLQDFSHEMEEMDG